MNGTGMREAVGIFTDMDALEEAISELEQTAFGREDISILGNKEDLKEKFGRPEVRPERVEDDPDAPRQTPVRMEERAVGTGAMIGGGAYLGAVGALLAAGAAVTIPAVITAAAIGGGSAGILARILGGSFDEHLEKQIEKGGVVLWVKTIDEEHEKKAGDILKKHGARHVHIHETGQDRNLHMKEAMRDPGDTYASPEDVLEDRFLSASEKRKVLANWADEMRHILESRAENMSPAESGAVEEAMLQKITSAIDSLDHRG